MIQHNVLSHASSTEREARAQFTSLLKDTPIPHEELILNLPLYVRRQELAHVLFLHDLYQQILDVNGIIMEFGVRWGRNLSLLHSFRGMYEPYNYTRKIVGFDTFEGFPSTDEKDGEASVITKGAYNVTEGYQQHLEQVLDYQESTSPLAHLKKYELVKGDATQTIVEYLEKHPETIISFAYFDFDIYEPTKKCLEAIKPYLTKGSIIGFDELNSHQFPGETLALKEVLGLDSFKIRRSPLTPYASYIVYE